jgi:hypothetical protein
MNMIVAAVNNDQILEIRHLFAQQHCDLQCHQVRLSSSAHRNGTLTGVSSLPCRSLEEAALASCQVTVVC